MGVLVSLYIAPIISEIKGDKGSQKWTKMIKVLY